MLIRINDTTEIDTDTELEPAERHILQKLFGWRDMVDSIEEFRARTDDSLNAGWNKSGPIRAGRKLSLVIDKLEAQLRTRLEGDKPEN